MMPVFRSTNLFREVNWLRNGSSGANAGLSLSSKEVKVEHAVNSGGIEASLLKLTERLVRLGICPNSGGIKDISL